ncbi:hypothetical protein ABZ345_32045 [Lentzea sp. NPDC005914]|uniref:hypothetical protein n=1 Tax=Lentzea sp. NPDC005914 TaxID=3154572 RepID=UPI0033FFDB2E
MTGEQIRSRGLKSAAAGVGLVAWVVVVAALAEVRTWPALVAAAVTSGLICLCPVAGGVVATRITDAESAARLRHVFVVLEGVGLTLFFPLYLSVFGIEPWGLSTVGVVLALVAPVAVALVLTSRATRAVHLAVVAASGPIVPDSDAGAQAQRIRVLGTVLVAVGIALSVCVVAVVFTTSGYKEVLPVFGLPVTLMPVLLGTRLVRVRDVYSARRYNIGAYFGVLGACSYAVAKFVSLGGAAGMLLAGLAFAAVVLLVIALLVLREFIGELDRQWRERLAR